MQFFIALDKPSMFFGEKISGNFCIPTIFSELAHLLGVKRTAQHLTKPHSISTYFFLLIYLHLLQAEGKEPLLS